MEKNQKPKLAKILLLIIFIILLVLTPFISSSMRSSYLYFILNLLIIVLGFEAGFFFTNSKPIDEPTKPAIYTTMEASYNTSSIFNTNIISSKPITKPMTKPDDVKKDNTGLKRCKSRPSIFFIAGYKHEKEEILKEEKVKIRVRTRVVKEDEISKQELFVKAETFIENFYKQLKMQRENSWQNLNSLYQKAF